MSKGKTTLQHRRTLDALMGANGGKRAGNKAEALRIAEYSKSVIHTPSKVFNSAGFKAIADPLLKRLEQARDRALAQMAMKADKASYFDATNAVAQLSKQIQLLTGGATEQMLTISISKEIAEKNGISIGEGSAGLLEGKAGQ